MSTLSSVSISYSNDSITATLSTGEIIVVDIDVNYGDLTGEQLAQSEHRMAKIISGLLNANLRYIKSAPTAGELP
jgi:hypothetical protein